MKRETKAERRHRLYTRLQALGFTFTECEALRRIEMTLQRWSELECGNSDNYKSFAIERDEKTEKPFMVIHPHCGGKSLRYAVADREKGAMRRLTALVSTKPGLVSYHQGDPRGCALYVGRKSDLGDLPADQGYNRLVAVCD